MIVRIKNFLKRSGILSEEQFDENRINDATLSVDEVFRLNRLIFEKRWRLKIPPQKNLSDFEIVKTLGRGKFGRVILTRLRNTEENFSTAMTTTMTMTSMTSSTLSSDESESLESLDSSLESDDDSPYEYYALKVMKKRVVLSKSRIARVVFEKKILQCLVRFPFVVNYVCHFKDNANLYLVLEFVAGGDMLTHLRRHRRFNDELTHFYASQIVISLEFLHSLGIVHRDIKPQNIVIGQDGFVKLADFGLAKRLEAGCLTGTKCGTRVYMAPEMLQMRRTPYSFNADWWSTGVTIYEMKVGRVPFEAVNSVELLIKIMEGSLTYPPYMPNQLVDLLNGLLEPNIKKRLVTTKEVKKQPYFAEVNWHALYTKQINPPFLPTVIGDNDTNNFDLHHEEEIEEWDEDIYEEEFRDF